MLHIVGPDFEWIAGPVPDDVDRVAVATKSGAVDVEVRSNVFALRLPTGEYQDIEWRMKNGSTVRPLS